MGGGYENNEEVFGGDGMRGGNGLTSGSNVQGTELIEISLSLNGIM